MLLKANEASVLGALADDALVLDVGGWADPLARADWVIDLMPYETRGLYGAPPDPASERFSARTWVVRDICDRDPWPFDDGQFDFAVCSHTLEDVRDPVGVCRELQRVARAGYLEMPTRLAEQSAGVEGDWPGWSHHHWICDPREDGVAFTFKHHVVHRPGNHLPREVGEALTLEEKVWGLRWDGSFHFEERILFDPHALEAELQATVRSRSDEYSGSDPIYSRRRRWRIR